jgi:methionine synthase II (cobalamin-independent)
MVNTLLPTTVVGSYPQPSWLIHREAPNCGMKCLSRETAFGNTRSLAAGAATGRHELA